MSPAPSYASGVSDVPLIGETIGDNLRSTARRVPARDALVSCEQGLRWTYAELDAAVDRLASGLLARGVAKGDRVGLWSPNRWEWVLTQYATARIGAVLVNVNPAYRTHELAYALRHSGTSVLFAARAFKTSDYAAMVAQVRGELEGLREVVFFDDDPAWEALIATPVDAAAVAARAADAQLRRPDRHPVHVAARPAPRRARR